VDEEQDRAGVGLHRAGHVAEHDQLPVRLHAPAERPVDRVAAGRERGTD